jgi:hypothetical protein
LLFGIIGAHDLRCYCSVPLEIKGRLGEDYRSYWPSEYGKPIADGFGIEDFGDVTGLPAAGGEAFVGGSIARAPEGHNLAFAAFGGDFAPVEVIGDGMIAPAGSAESDHVEDPGLFDEIGDELADLDAFGSG